MNEDAVVFVKSACMADFYWIEWRDTSLGNVSTMLSGKYKFFPKHVTFNRLDPYAKELVSKAVNDKCAILNITARLLK